LTLALDEEIKYHWHYFIIRLI